MNFHLGRREFLTNLTTGAILSGAAAALPSRTQATDTPDPSAGLKGIQALLSRKEPVLWIFTGDSITHGALHTLGWRSYPEHFAERVRWELRRVRDIVINTGISGDTTAGLLADLDWRVLHFKPHAVSVMLGMNDCSKGEAGREAFRQNLTEITRRIHEAGAIVFLNTPNTILVENAANRADLPAYAQIVRDVAAATGAPLVDHWKFWEQTKPTATDLEVWIEDKSIHPGVYGHRAFARLIFKELGIFDPQSPTCHLQVP